MQNIFRIGEIPLWHQTSFERIGPDLVWKMNPKGRHHTSAYEVMGIDWEIYTEDRTLLQEMLWHGVLRWDFFQTIMDVGPLSMYDGTPFEIIDSAPASDLEKLAAVKAEEDWAQRLQVYLMGKSYLYRGRARYTRHPVLLPAHTNSFLTLSFPRLKEEVEGDVRIRVILRGNFRSAIEVG
jgi:hypothetical protein